MTHFDLCYHCSDTGFVDWAEKQEEPCPRGCRPRSPMTDKQRDAYVQRLKLLGARVERVEFKDHTRHFTKMLFCGAGDQTRYDVACLHERIEKALNYLSGRQQGPHWREQPTQEMLDREKQLNDEADRVCEQVARDVAMALTGKGITFVE